MPRMSSWPLFLVVFTLMIASPAAGQDCTIAAYADAAGTVSGSCAQDPFFSVFIVMFVEDGATAAAYKVEFELFTDAFLQDRLPGPQGGGLFLDENPATIGTNVALAECVPGFDGAPILVERYTFAQIGDPYSAYRIVRISANTNQDPEYPVYVTCNQTERTCTPGPELVLTCGIPVEDSNFSTIKSLFN